MRRSVMLAVGAMAAAIFAAAPRVADANTFRFAFQGELISLDPDVQNESFTNTFLNNIYEALARYDADGKVEPALATGWKMVEPTVWRFEIRQGVKFHQGEALTADDIVFSIERAMSDTSDQRSVIPDIAEVRKVGDFTVDVVTKRPTPILIRQLTYILMMSKSWSEANNARKPADIRKGEVNFAGFNTNGTGPFMLKSRKPDVRTELVANPNWWDTRRHNLTEVHFVPIKSDATRVAALLSNDIDMAWPVALQDIPRVNRTAGLKVLEGPEERTVFLGMDQFRDELLYSSVKGRNPFKDVRVRQAIYQAIDIEAIKSRIMRGTSLPTALMAAPSLQGFDPALNNRYPYDPEASKKLLAEAGYPEGFGVSLDCPNDRYINDEAICQAITAMLARVGVKVTLLAQSKSIYFGKILKQDTSFYLLGWASTSTRDALDSYVKLTSCRGGVFGIAPYNIGAYCNSEVDKLLGAASVEIDMAKRQALLSAALKIHKEEFGHLPLHQQAQSWGIRTVFEVPQTPEGSLRLWQVRSKN